MMHEFEVGFIRALGAMAACAVVGVVLFICVGAVIGLTMPR